LKRMSRIGKAMLDSLVLVARRLSLYWESLSFREAVRFAYLDFSSRTTAIELMHQGYPFPISLRGGTCDIRTFCQIIGTDGYQQELATEPSVIVDAGAHIGLASLWYANRYPDARIIALEPDRKNYQLLKRNTRFYPNIVALNAALWSSSGTVALTDPHEDSWAFQVRRQEDASVSDVLVPSICLSDLMEDFNLDHIDLLKVDIEGAEKEVFEDSAEWIDRVSAMVIELHDHLKSGCSRAFYSATAGFSDQVTGNGEITFVRRNPGFVARKPARLRA